MSISHLNIIKKGRGGGGMGEGEGKGSGRRKKMIGEILPTPLIYGKTAVLKGKC